MTSPRRSFLKRSGTALLAASLGGCLSDGDAPTADEPSGGDATDTATPTAAPTETPTDTDAPTATDAETATDADTETDADTATPGGDAPGSRVWEWLPAPAALDTDHYSFTSVATGPLVEMKDSLGDGAVAEFEGDSGVPGAGSFADARAVHAVGTGTLVVETDVDREAAASGFEEQGLSESETRRGFAVFSGDSGAAALRDDALVSAIGRRDEAAATATVEAIVDAQAGEAERYREASAACDDLAAALGSAHLVRGRTHALGRHFDGGLGEGLAIEVGAEETAVRTPVAFREGRATEGPVVEWASGSDVFYGRKPGVATEGRVVTASATVPSAEIEAFRSQLPGERNRSSSPTPAVSFSFEYDATGDGPATLEITHNGGDTVDRSELSLRGEGFADADGVDQTAPGQWQGSASGDGDAVVAGDRVTVGVESDCEISVVWESADGNSSAVLGNYEGPDA